MWVYMVILMLVNIMLILKTLANGTYPLILVNIMLIFIAILNAAQKWLSSVVAHNGYQEYRSTTVILNAYP